MTGSGPQFSRPAPIPFPEPRSQPRTKKRRRNRWILALIVLVVLAVIGTAGWFVGNQLGWFGSQSGQESGAAVEDYPGPGTGEVMVTIETGELGSDMARKLFEAGVVKSPEAFIVAFDANPASGSIRPGTYALKKEMSGDGAVAALLDDANRSDNSAAVIPGHTVSQVVDNMVALGKFSREEIEAAMEDTAALGLPEQANGNLEGWLAPGSYEVVDGATPKDLFTEMIAGTVQFLNENGAPESEWMDILTKASIVEREVVFTADMPKVARVIENRLADPADFGGMLGMDSTTLYGVGKVGGVPTAEDLADDNPYNTRLNPGLPPGPISNPSRDAILAVLNPEEGDWLYFATVDLDTGETLFTDDINEHNRNQQRFAQWCEANPGRC